MQALCLFLFCSVASAGTISVGWNIESTAEEYRVHYTQGATINESAPYVLVLPAACQALTDSTKSCGDSTGQIQCRGTVTVADNAPAWVSVRACRAGGINCSPLVPAVVGGWPRPLVSGVTRNAQGKIFEILGVNFKSGAQVKVDTTVATLQTVNPTKITLVPVAGYNIQVRNAAEEVGGCAPFGLLNVGVGTPTGLVRTDDLTAF